LILSLPYACRSAPATNRPLSATKKMVKKMGLLTRLILLPPSIIDINHVNRLGWTALLEAVILGDGGPIYQKIVRLLVDHGADTELPDGDGVGPLAHANNRRYRKIAEILEAAKRP